MQIKTSLLFKFLLLLSFQNFAQDDKIYQFVEQQPEFIGGHGAFLRYLESNINFSNLTAGKKNYGRVFMTMIVEKNGSLSNIEALKGLGYGCDEEAIRVLQNMPNWKAGRQNGKAVRVKYNLPITFDFYGNSKISTENDDDRIYQGVESQPNFHGSTNDYFIENMSYPTTALQRNIQGEIIAIFVVEKDGRLSNIKIKDGLGYGCDEEALRLLKSMPAWQVGEHNGQKVRVKYGIMIPFSINDYKQYSKEYARFRRY